MEKGIYYGLLNKEFHYNDNSISSDVLEDDLKHKYINIEEMSKNIILVSPFRYHLFPAWDVGQRNREVIKRLISEYKFKPLNEPVAEIIAEQYHICPHCGCDINIDYSSDESLVFDVGLVLKNLIKKGFLIGSYFGCKCKLSYSYLYYYNIDVNSQNGQRIKEIVKGRKIYIRFRYIINNEKNSYITVTLYLKQIKKFFDEYCTRGFKYILENKTSEYILQQYFDNKENKESESAIVTFEPIKYPYSRFKSRQDYKLIKEYEKINSCEDKLRKCFFEKLYGDLF